MAHTPKELREWREKRRLTQKEVATMLGMSRGGYANYEADVSPPVPVPDNRMAVLRAMGFGTPPSDAEIVQIRPSGVVEIPYIGMIAASERVKWTDPTDTDSNEAVPRDMGDEAGRFCCRVLGDSMYDFLWPDDLCVFHQSPVPKIGAIILFRANQGHVTIKQLKHDGKGFQLHPLNTAYADEPADGMPVGYLVGIIRMDGSRRTTIYDPSGIKP